MLLYYLRTFLVLIFALAFDLAFGQCTDPPVSQTYCYGNGEYTELVFYPTTPGVPVSINFIQGVVENNNWDVFQVFDGLVGGPILFQNGIVNTDVAGVSVVASVGNPITILFDSDGSVSCASASFVPMIFDVFCGGAEVPGCTDPTADNFDPSATIDDGSCFSFNCGGSIISGSYCYGNGDYTVFSYAPITPGEQVLLAFAQGAVESGTFDQLIVYDGPGPGSPILYQNTVGAVTDLSGLDFISTLGNGISFSISSDGSVSCGSGSYLPFLWEVYCAIPPVFGCMNPSSPNYNPDATVDDGSCIPCINPNPPGCPSIDLGADISLPECVDPCLPLDVTADFFDVGSTTSYTVEAIDFCPPYPFTVGTPIFVGFDDIFSDVIPLPFDFCFYGNVFNQAVIGANGLITFDITQANQICAFAYSASVPTPSAPVGLTQGGIYNNSINGAYHDIDPGQGGSISYAVLGSAPCRTLVVNFYDVPHFSCTSIRTTQQIVLYETTNVVEVYIEDKPTCAGWNSGNAVIGLQNATGTMGVVPPGRQTGAWSASNEAWRFNPAGASIVSIEWSQQGLGVVGTGSTLQVCPSTDVQTFVAEASYLRCDGVGVVVSDIVSVQCALLVLPVEWLGFDAKLISNDEEVLCSWQTATELENDYFSVQRSQDGFAWEDIGFVDGAGTSYDNHDYSFIDQKPHEGTSYYRIKQTDFNGATDFTHRAVIMRSELAIFEAYPNPSSGKFTLSGVDGGILQVLDLRGRLVEEFMSFGSEIELSDKATGAYLLKYIARNGDVSYARVQLD